MRRGRHSAGFSLRLPRLAVTNAPVDRDLSPVQCHKRTVFASAQSDTSIRCHGLGICSAEFLISYPHQGRSLGPKTTKRMGAIAACDLHRERRHSVKYDFVFDH